MPWTVGGGFRSRSRQLGIGGVLGVAGVAVLLGLSPAAITTGTSHHAQLSASTTSGCGYLALPTPICHVIILYLENENVNYVLNHAPFQKYLANKYAFASEYFSVQHFSFPNYIASTSGTVTNFMHSLNKTNVFDLIRNKTHTPTYASYLEDMPFACDRNSTLNYKPSHNAYVWYADVWRDRARCQAHDLNFTSWNASVSQGTVPNYVFLGPNATHSCWKKGFGLPVCDPWLRGFLSPLINDSFFNTSVFFITYDEGTFNSTLGANGTVGGGHIFTTAVSPFACPGFKSFYNYSHYNLLTTTEWLLGLGRTGFNDSWSKFRPMQDLFCFPNGTGGGGVLPFSLLPSHLGSLAPVLATAAIPPRSRDPIPTER